jgi:hypothetical protein
MLSDVSEVRTASIIASSLMMEAARTSETSVYNYFTRQYIPEDNSELQVREDLQFNNLKGEMYIGYRIDIKW